jgi:DDE superfamily endonuclease
MTNGAFRHYLAGFPGSAHDERVLKRTKLAQNPGRFFSPTQYLLGDSAFESRWFLISAYKKPSGHDIPREHEILNEKMKPARAISEHTIGILKCRFPMLRSMRLVLWDAASMMHLLMYVDCCMIMHKLLLKWKGEIPNAWLDNDSSDVTELDASPLDDDDELHRGIPPGADNGLRRDQLMLLFNETPC